MGIGPDGSRVKLCKKHFAMCMMGQPVTWSIERAIESGVEELPINMPDDEVRERIRVRLTVGSEKEMQRLLDYAAAYHYSRSKSQASAAVTANSQLQLEQFKVLLHTLKVGLVDKLRLTKAQLRLLFQIVQEDLATDTELKTGLTAKFIPALSGKKLQITRDELVKLVVIVNALYLKQFTLVFKNGIQGGN